jgi:tetratricopeptide (TPR) repeat protein
MRIGCDGIIIMTNKTIIWILGAFGVAIALIAGWFFYTQDSKAPVYSVKNTPQAVLTALNRNYAEAAAYKKEGKYALALESYEKALSAAQDNFQATQIKFNIAGTNEKLGNYTEAIRALKEIALDTTNRAVARANAVQEIGLIYSIYSTAVDAGTREQILAETFKDAPYDSFKDGNSVNVAYTKLYEYAASIYPVGVSEARIASGYTGELLNTLKGATTTPEGKAYAAIIRQSLAAADADIQRMKSIPGEAVLVPATFVREGAVLGRLATIGAATAKEAEPYFRAGLAYDSALGNKPGSFNTFNYAAFLVDQYGMARSADIQTLLAVFNVDTKAAVYLDIARFLDSARTDATLAHTKQDARTMARISPSFKTYLLSLGWKASDF